MDSAWAWFRGARGSSNAPPISRGMIVREVMGRGAQAHFFTKPIVRRGRRCLYRAFVQRLLVTANTRPSSRMSAASAAAFARPEVGVTINSIAILAVLLVLLAGAAWTLVT
jgi:hypothetical protein